MKVPNADNAEISPQKLSEYLLNTTHRRGAAKAKLLIAIGYRTHEWQRLEADLRAQHLSLDVDATVDNEYGQRFEIAAGLTGPNGKVVPFRSIWQIDTGTDTPRLITMYPE